MHFSCIIFIGGIMYKKKCLFKNSNATWGKDPTAQESIYAYLYGTDDAKTTGRYRIRVTKMSAADLMALGLAPEGTPPDFFGMQATLDKWHKDAGWMPLFDWVGDPEASIFTIERELNRQFQAFVTGIALDEGFSFDLPKPPKTKKIKLPPKEVQQDENQDEPEDVEAQDKTENDDDFEWL